MATLNCTPKQINRFWGYVNILSENECWNWQRSKIPAGYGRMVIYGKSKYAHRLAYELTFGEIPQGLEVCHECDNPCCCNPSHLFLGTHTENMQDRQRKNRCNTGRMKLTLNDVLFIRSEHAKGVTHFELAHQLHVTPRHIQDIVLYKRWKYTPELENK